jgi:hypothetical protein
LRPFSSVSLSSKEAGEAGSGGKGSFLARRESFLLREAGLEKVAEMSTMTGKAPQKDVRKQLMFLFLRTDMSGNVVTKSFADTLGQL